MEDKKNVLIIDDDSRNIFALSLYLKAKGFQSVSALSAKEGIEILNKSDNVSVVFMDIMMPEMDGYEAIRKIREIPRFSLLPIIAVTAQAMIGDKEKCLDAGASGYISKPINMDKLVAMINDLT
ncbi:response regulator [Pseudopedobacter sp.]|uniref:response regulator n=1 Tax=Pseudopedobacter sp. TaxID=1936787 RepID=UPI00334236C0